VLPVLRNLLAQEGRAAVRRSARQGAELRASSLSGCRSGRSSGALGPLTCYLISLPGPHRLPSIYPLCHEGPRATVGLALGHRLLVIRPSALPRRPRPAGHPVTVGPPTGERGKRHGSRWSALLDERPWAVALAWADGDGMGRLPPQPPDDLDQAAASILGSPRPPPEARIDVPLHPGQELTCR
jgi:hypothetical protein